MASSGLGPSRLSGGSVPPTCTAWNDEPVKPLTPMTRSSQPVRVDDPERPAPSRPAPRSASGPGPRARKPCTTPNVPAVQYGMSGAKDGCSPNSRRSRAACRAAPGSSPGCAGPRGGVAVGHHGAEPVESAPHGQDDQRVAGVARGGQRHLGRQHRGAQPRGADDARAAQQGPSRQRRALVVRAAAALGGRPTVRWSSSEVTASRGRGCRGSATAGHRTASGPSRCGGVSLSADDDGLPKKVSTAVSCSGRMRLAGADARPSAVDELAVRRRQLHRHQVARHAVVVRGYFVASTGFLGQVRPLSVALGHQPSTCEQWLFQRPRTPFADCQSSRPCRGSRWAVPSSAARGRGRAPGSRPLTVPRSTTGRRRSWEVRVVLGRVTPERPEPGDGSS